MANVAEDVQVGKSKEYSSKKYKLAFIEITYSFFLLFIFQWTGVSKHLALKISAIAPGSFLVLPLYFLAGYGIYYCIELPLIFYDSFLIEHRFSLSTQKISNWLQDQFKGLMISYIIGLVCLEALYYTLRHNPHTWWLVISVFWILLSIVLARITPQVLLPLFFKYKKISDEALKARILALAEKMNLKVMNVFEIDFSKKTRKANAAFIGWGATRRVILADTLKSTFTNDEIEVIMAHEFAHYKCKHLFKLLCVGSIITMVCFYSIFMTHAYVLGMFGLVSLTDIAALPIILMYFMIIGIVLQPLQNYISRAFEKNADRMAIHYTGLKEGFISSMEKLAEQNLADRNPHPLIKFFFFDHPPIDERIAMARSLMVNG